eukprot:1160571-Pelagomonas_calceolata.AAC.4
MADIDALLNLGMSRVHCVTRKEGGAQVLLALQQALTRAKNLAYEINTGVAVPWTMVCSANSSSCSRCCRHDGRDRQWLSESFTRLQDDGVSRRSPP